MSNPISNAFAVTVDPPKPKNPRKLDTLDQILRGVSSGLIVADWLMTVDGLRKGRAESNPILGKHPSLGRANTLIGAGLLANAFLVPRITRDEGDLRKFMWLATTALELDALWHNKSAHLGFNFRF